MTKVENLPCPTCAGQLVTDGRAWVECAACGYRHGAFVKPLGDGKFSVKLRTGGRKSVSRKKMPVNGRMYFDDLQAIEARGYTVQRVLDAGVAWVLSLPSGAMHYTESEIDGVVKFIYEGEFVPDKKPRLQISLSNIECPECRGHNYVKYDGIFSGVIYACADCLNSFPSPFCECKLPGESVTKPKICPICEKPRRPAEG